MSNMNTQFRRDVFTWLSYILIGSFSYVQAMVGPIVPFLHEELNLNYTLDSIHMSALALGMVIAGLSSEWLGKNVGRGRVINVSMIALVIGLICLTISPFAFLTITWLLISGIAGGLIAINLQSALAEWHQERQAVAMVEASMTASLMASLSPFILGGLVVISLGWRPIVLLPVTILVIMLLVLRKMPLPEQKQRVDVTETVGESMQLKEKRNAHRVPLTRLKGKFWLYWSTLILGIAVEWSIAFWGAEYLTSVGLSRADAATLVGAFFFMALVGRFVGSWLTRMYRVEKLLPFIFASILLGFLLFWCGPTPILHVIGLFMSGLAIANAYPLALSATIEQAKERVSEANSICALGGGMAMLIMPLLLGQLADVVKLRGAYVFVFALILLAFGLVVFANWRGQAATTKAALSTSR